MNGPANELKVLRLFRIHGQVGLSDSVILIVPHSEYDQEEEFYVYLKPSFLAVAR